MKLRAREAWHMPLITMYATTQIMFTIAKARVKQWLVSNAHPQMSFLQMQ